jgi:membrane associated rhomboid family serine protease
MLKNIPPGLRNLLILIVLFELAKHSLPKIGFDMNELYLFYPDSSSFRPWQLVTHMFCHGGFTHLLFNGIALFSFGAVMELKLGTKKFLSLFFISGFGAVLVHFISVAVVLYSKFGSIAPLHNMIVDVPPQIADAFFGFGPMVGASGALYGVLIAFVVFYPNERLIFLFIPYPIKAKILIPIVLLLDVIGGFGQFNWDPIAHFAHLGGALTGFLVVKFWERNKISRNWS